MSKSNIASGAGIIAGSILVERFMPKLVSPEVMEKKWITPYKESTPSPKPVAQSMWSMFPFYIWIFASVLVAPILIMYFYPQIQSLFLNDPSATFFRNNGQYLMMITWLLTGTLYFLLIGVVTMRFIPKVMNRYYASRTEDNLIAAKKIKPITNQKERTKRLEKIASEYDLRKMNSDDIKRFIKVDAILLLITLPFYLLGIYSYTKITPEEIAIAPTWGYSEQVYSWDNLNSVEIYLESDEHITPHFDLAFKDGKTINIWDFAIPQQSTEDLISVRTMAEEKGVPVNIGFVYQDLSGLRESGRTQIQEVMDIKTGADKYIEEGSALYDLIHGSY